MSDFNSTGKALMALGAALLLLGAIVVFSDRIPFLKSLGRLPGDLSWKGSGWQVHFPLATSLILSLLLTLGLWLYSYLSGRGGR